jgi:hypothetical protein
MTVTIPVDESLAALVTIIRAARLTGDEATERIAQRKLWARYRVTVAFDRAPPLRGRARQAGPGKEASHGA